jgi:hypothetical protein
MGIGHGHLPAPSLGVFLPLVRVRAGTNRGTSDLCPVWTSNSSLTIQERHAHVRRRGRVCFQPPVSRKLLT